MTFFASSCCPCTRPMDHATMSAADTPTINSDRFMSSSLNFNCSSRFEPKADAFYTDKPDKQLQVKSGGWLISSHSRTPGCPISRVFCDKWGFPVFQEK